MAYAALVVDLTAKLTNLQQGMDRAVKIAQDSSKKIESAFSFTGAAKAGAGFFAAQLGLQSIRDALVTVKELSDEWTRTRVLVENVTKSVEEAAFAQTKLYEAAQATRQNYGELTRSFASFARNADQLNISSEQAVDLQKTIAQAIALSGARAESAASALVQFGQGIAAGVLRGEELNSVLEQTPKLAKAIADGMGVPIGVLIKMGKEGELTAERIIAALQKIAPKMQEEFNKVTPTIADAFVAVNNSVGNLLSGINKIVPVADTLANVLIGAANAIDKIANTLKLTGSNETQRAAGEAQRARQQAALIEPFTNEEFLARDFRRRNPGMIVDVDAIRAQAELYRKQRAELLQVAAEFEAQLDRGGIGPNGMPIPTMAEADAAAQRKREADELERQKAFAKVFLQNRGISNAFEKDVELLQKAFQGRNFDDKAVRDEYNQMYRELLERSGFFPKGKREANDDPLAKIIQFAEKKWGEIDKMREKVLESIDPLRELRKELENINKLEALGEQGGGISQTDAIAARANLEAEMEEARKKFESSPAFVGPPREAFEAFKKVRGELDKYLESLRVEADLVTLSETERQTRVKLLDAEAQGLVRGSREWDKYREAIENALVQQRLSEIDQMRGGASDKRTDDIRLLTERLQQQLDESAFFGGDTKQYTEQYTAAVQAILGVNQVLKDDFYKLGDAFGSAFEKAVVEGGKLSDVLAGLAEDVAKLVLRQQITAPLAAFINKGLGGTKGGENTLFDLVVTGLKGLFGRALGGNVDAGKTYLVGERGPELFTAGANGRITPNSALAAGGSTTHNHYYIDSRTDRSVIVADIQRAQLAALGAQRDARARGNEAYS